MELRLIVMGGKAALQKFEGGRWAHVYIQPKAGALRPGVYQLHTAPKADPAVIHTGQILAKHAGRVYQESAAERRIVWHEEGALSSAVIAAGDVVTVDHSQDQPVMKVTASAATRRRITRSPS